MIHARKNDLAMLRRLVADARPFWWHIAAITALSLLGTPLALLQPVPVQIVVDSVLGTRDPPHVLHLVFPDAALTRSGLLIGASLLLVGAALLQHAEGYASWLLQMYTGERLVLEFRARLFRHTQRLSMTYHDMQGTADSLYRIQSDASAVQHLIVSGLIPLSTSLIMIGAMIVVIAWLDWQLALVALTVAPVLFVLTEVYRRRARAWWTRVKDADSLSHTVAHQALSSLRVVKAFGQEDREESRFVGRLRNALDEQLRAIAAEAAFGMSVAAAIGLGTATVLYIGVRHVQGGTLTLGQLLLVIAYLAQLYRPLETVSKKVASLQASLAGAERAFALLDHTIDVPESRHARAVSRARGEFLLRDVSFAYSPDHPVLCGVSLDIPAGSHVGIAGKTGAGKSTLLSLLPRFIDPTRGEVLLDGIDLREFRLADLRKQFAIVLQEPVLFSCTIAENIAYGRPEASEAEIVAAAEAAYAHDFIGRLPNGYRTDVGERGMTLSGGERQRISLARAFLRDAPILLLDEPTSAVDRASEALIMHALQRLMVGRTTLLATHRLETLDVCDIRLVVEDDGRVRHAGSRENSASLMKTSG